MAITRTARGTAQSKTTGTQWNAITTVTIAAGSSIIVCLAHDPETVNSVIFDPAGVNETLTQNAVATNENDVYTRIFSKHNSAGGTNKTIQVNFAAGVAAAITVTELIQTAGNTIASAGTQEVNTGTGTAAASTTSITITPNSGLDAAWFGVVGTEGPNGDAAGTWNNPNNAGQRLGTTGAGATSNITVSEGYEINTVEVTQALDKTGMTSRDWAAVITGYKEAAGATPLTVSVSDDGSANWADALFNVALGLVYNFADDANNLADILTTLGYGNLHTDDINNWGERQDLGYGLLITDDANNLLDAIIVNISYEITVSDNIDTAAFQQNAFQESAFQMYGWSDEINTSLLGFLSVDVSDNAFNLSDNLTTLGYGHIFEDTLSLTDEIKVILSHLKDLVDSLNNWADSASVVLEVPPAGPIEITASDNLHNWTDQINTFMTHLLEISDNMNNWLEEIRLIQSYEIAQSDSINNLVDQVELIRGDLISFADDLSNWGDVTQLQLSYLLSFSDNLHNWADAIETKLSIALSFSDDLNNWLDSVAFSSAVAISTSDNLSSWRDLVEVSLALQRLGIRDYLRRYLNDVVTPDAVVAISTILHSIDKPEINIYLRRYLNDISSDLLVHPKDNLNNWKDSVSKVLV